MCGLTRRFDEESGETVTEVVAAGGEDGSNYYGVVEIFSLRDEEWRTSPRQLPHTLQYGATVQVGGGKPDDYVDERITLEPGKLTHPNIHLSI